jgi:hypothetical protein
MGEEAAKEGAGARARRRRARWQHDLGVVDFLARAPGAHAARRAQEILREEITQPGRDGV